MMQYIRERATSKFAKFLFLGIGISFLGFGGSGMLGRIGDSTVANVNGVKIPTSYLSQAYTDYLRQNGGVLPEGQSATNAKGEVLNSLIQKEVMLQAANKMGIVVADLAIKETITSLPFLQGANGEFDAQNYELFLQQQGLTAAVWEDNIRQQMTLDLLISSIGKTAIVTDADIEGFAKVDREKRDLSIVYIPFERFNNEIQISDEMLSAYYEQHRASLLTEPKVKLAYITMPTMVSDESTINLSDDEINLKVAALEEKYKANEVRASDQLIIQFNTDEERENAVALLTKIQKALKEGSLTYEDAKTQVESHVDGLFYNTGNIRRAAALSSVDQAIFQLSKDDQYSEPVASENAVHLIRLLDIIGDNSVASADIRKEAEMVLRTEKKTQLDADQIQKFQEVAEKNSDNLDLLIQEFGVTAVETDWLNMNRNDQELADKNTHQIVNQEMVLIGGRNSEAYQTDSGEVRVLRVTDYETVRSLTFDEAKDDIRVALVNLEAQKKAEEIIADVNKKLETGEASLSDALQPYDLTANDYEKVEIRTIISVSNNDAFLIESLIKGFEVQKSNPMTLQTHIVDGGLGAVMVTGVTPGDLSEYSEDETSQLRERLQAEMAQAETILFMQGLYNQSKIEMYQTSFLTE